jgi:hypothetical protein
MWGRHTFPVTLGPPIGGGGVVVAETLAELTGLVAVVH